MKRLGGYRDIYKVVSQHGEHFDIEYMAGVRILAEIA
jgi:hypothetical protein